MEKLIEKIQKIEKGKVSEYSIKLDTDNGKFITYNGNLLSKFDSLKEAREYIDNFSDNIEGFDKLPFIKMILIGRNDLSVTINDDLNYNTCSKPETETLYVSANISIDIIYLRQNKFKKIYYHSDKTPFTSYGLSGQVIPFDGKLYAQLKSKFRTISKQLIDIHIGIDKECKNHKK
jgi:hypothetical protein